MLVVVTMLGTLAVTVLGDGLADTGKQGHLVVNAALGWVCVAVVFGATRVLRGMQRQAVSQAASHPAKS